MTKLELQNKIKSTGTAYLLWFFLGAHYAYINRWGVQILYWLTLGGVGIWAFIDLFRISGIIRRHNNPIYNKIEEIEVNNRQKELIENAALLKAV